MGIRQVTDMAMAAMGNPSGLAAGKLAKVGAKDALESTNPLGAVKTAKKVLFGGGGDAASKEMRAAAKAEKAKQAVNSFAPNILKADKDGRNTVSAERAMQGQRLVDRTSKRVTTSGGAMENLAAKTSTIRGAAGQKSIRDDMAELARKEKQRYKDPKVFKTIQREEEHARMASAMDDNAIHRFDAMRDEKSALIQGNSSGYENPRLAPQTRQSGTPNTPASYSAKQSWRNTTFDNRPNRTAGSALLASRMNY